MAVYKQHFMTVSEFRVALRPRYEHICEQTDGFLQLSRYIFLLWVRNVFIMLELHKQFRFPCLGCQVAE